MRNETKTWLDSALGVSRNLLVQSALRFKSRNAWIALGFAFLALVSVVATTNEYGITFDEVTYFIEAKANITWVELAMKSLASGDFRTPFLTENIDTYWTKVNTYHPAVSKIGSGTTWAIFHSVVNETTAYRLSSALFFSLMVLMLYILMSEHYGLYAAVFACFALLLMPHAFALAHFATTDVPTATLWLASVFAFMRGLSSKKWSIATGIIFGLALNTKFTPLAALGPLAVCTALFWRGKAFNNFIAITLLSPIVLLVGWPLLWPDIGARLTEWIRISAFREAYIPIPVYYLGTQYFFRAPWHYAIVMTLVTVPVGATLMFLAGMGKTIANFAKDSTGVVLLLNAVTPIALDLVPNAPTYDGVRVFFPAFPFLAALSGIGFSALLGFVIERIKAARWRDDTKRWLAKASPVALGCLLLLPALYDTVSIHPFGLSYYNAFIGGVRGAHRTGMETTFWGEAFNAGPINYLNSSAEPDSRVALFPLHPYYLAPRLQDQGMLRKDIRSVGWDLQSSDYIVLLSRQGMFSEVPWMIYRGATPRYSVRYDGVPLLSVYKFTDLPDDIKAKLTTKP